MPGWLTGKLSDFAGLYFFPMLLAVALARIASSPHHVAAMATLSTGVVFTALKLSPALAGLAVNVGARIVPDATDRLALPMLALSWRAMNERVASHASQRTFGLRERVTLVVASLASMATSAQPKVPQLTEPPDARRADYTPLRCAHAAAYAGTVEPDRVEIVLRTSQAMSACVTRVEALALIVDEVSVASIVAPTRLVAYDQTAFRFVLDPPRTLSFAPGSVHIELTLAADDAGVQRVRLPLHPLAEIATDAGARSSP